MVATPQSVPAAVSESAHLSPRQKLAVLFIILGIESTAQILKNLDPDEVEGVCTEMAKVGVVSRELQRSILEEFGQVVAEATTALHGGAEFTQNALEKGLGQAKASVILNRIAPTRPPVPAIQKIAELDSSQIVTVLKQERSQTIALVISCLPAQKASQILNLLEPDQREQVVERLATLGPTPVETIQRLVEVLLEKTGVRKTQLLSQTGGVKSAASLLNALGKKASQPLLTSLEERNPELGQAIRQNMFTFEDLARLDTATLQRMLREVDLRDLAIALKRASEPLRAALLGCISKRAGETVKEEMSFLAALKLREIEASQARIIAVLRRLETEGEIQLADAAGPEGNELAA